MTEGQPYPTVAMLKMMNRHNELEKEDVADKVAIVEFQKDYVMKTQLTTGDALMKIITLFRIHLDDKREGIDHKAKMAEIQGLKDFLPEGEDMKEVEVFYNELIRNYISGKYVFYGVLKDDKTAIPFDLKEDQNDFRLITTKECGSCGQAFVPLHLCVRCKKAAYCNKACQKEDFKFHKLFCVEFAKQLQ